MGAPAVGFAMKKLVRTIVVILIVFVALSVGIYRSQLRRILRPPAQRRNPIELRIVSGTISGVDEENKTLVLDEEGESLVIAFDDGTAVTEIESGEAISADSISAGDEATVKYTERGGTRRAGAISVSTKARKNH
ncbi:MAG TPA: hypothetical protein VFV34_06715 [Blastocatellia bacterium]|nr:hypothetical protein [Blastocatellia bacterium]